jgi:hypothetical protein
MSEKQNELSIEELSKKREERIKNAANIILNTDFDDPKTIKRLRKQITNDPFQERDIKREEEFEDLDVSLEYCFLTFLKQIKEKILLKGDFETFKIIYGVREKIKNFTQLTQNEIDIVRGYGLQHFEGANLINRDITVWGPMEEEPDNLDLRNAALERTSLKGVKANILLSSNGPIEYFDASGVEHLTIENKGGIEDVAIINSTFSELNIEGDMEIVSSKVEKLGGGYGYYEENGTINIIDSKISKINRIKSDWILESKIGTITDSDINFIDEKSMSSVANQKKLETETLSPERFGENRNCSESSGYRVIRN